MLAIVTSHPIQNQAPLWRALAAAGVKFEVWFLTPHAVKATPSSTPSNTTGDAACLARDRLVSAVLRFTTKPFLDEPGEH